MVIRLICHDTKPARCILDDGRCTLDSHVNVKNAVWYMRGGIPPRYPVPAIPYQVKSGIDGHTYLVFKDNLMREQHARNVPNSCAACYDNYENAIRL